MDFITVQAKKVEKKVEIEIIVEIQRSQFPSLYFNHSDNSVSTLYFRYTVT